MAKDLFWSKQDLEEMKMKGKASQGKIIWAPRGRRRREQGPAASRLGSG